MGDVCCYFSWLCFFLVSINLDGTRMYKMHSFFKETYSSAGPLSWL